jgi:hypothetical protein
LVLDNSMTVTRASYTGDIACPVSGCAILFSDIRRLKEHIDQHHTLPPSVLNASKPGLSITSSDQGRFFFFFFK